MADNTNDVFAEFEDLLAELPPVPEDRPMMALTEIREYREKQREEEMKKQNIESSQNSEETSNIAEEDSLENKEKSVKRGFTNKKVFADREISSFDDVFTCRNQDTQILDKQNTKLYASDLSKLAMLSKLMSKKIGVHDIIHNILNLYFEQNKERVKEVIARNPLF